MRTRSIVAAMLMLLAACGPSSGGTRPTEVPPDDSELHEVEVTLPHATGSTTAGCSAHIDDVSTRSSNCGVAGECSAYFDTSYDDGHCDGTTCSLQVGWVGIACSNHIGNCVVHFDRITACPATP